jgi:dTDP-4-amino-4,6-dideoxygalactose transaminase
VHALVACHGRHEGKALGDGAQPVAFEGALENRLGVGPGDEVICPSFTFFATAGCVARVGAKPVFADSLSESFNLDPSDFERRITPKTKAVIPVHLFGQPADMEPILAIARRHGIAVIEDAAQAFGAEYKDRGAGSMGGFGTVSFFPSKNLGALGDAGLLITNDSALAEKARLLRNHGAHPKYFHSMVGGNFRLDALQAALLSVKLKRLAGYTRKRQEHFAEYNRALAGVDGGEAVTLKAPAILPGRTHIANQYTLRVGAGSKWQGDESPRDALRTHLAGLEIASEIYYPVPLHQQECFKCYGPHPALPVAETLAREVISVPVFPELTAEEHHAVAEAIASWCQIQGKGQGK